MWVSPSALDVAISIPGRRKKKLSLEERDWAFWNLDFFSRQ